MLNQFNYHQKKVSYADYQDLNNKAITCKSVTICYGKYIACKHISGNIKNGSLTAIFGANGSGKSSLLKAINGMLPLYSGNLSLDHSMSGETAYLPQKSEIDTSFPITVQELVSTGLNPKNSFWQECTSNDLQKIKQALIQVNLLKYAESDIQNLSGGQLQRALFARVIVQDANLILLDEPFTGIDQHTINDLIKLIITWHTKGKTVIVVSHSLNIIKKYFPEVILLAKKCLGWGETLKILSNENLEKIFI